MWEPCFPFGNVHWRQVLWSSLISEAVAAVFLSSTTLLSQQSQSFQHSMKGYESSLAGSLDWLLVLQAWSRDFFFFFFLSENELLVPAEWEHRNGMSLLKSVRLSSALSPVTEIQHQYHRQDFSGIWHKSELQKSEWWAYLYLHKSTHHNADG